ncbi:MAG: CBS domain containing-hemolysin-like protein [Myxococcota bacterium]|jgi:CBS domain containing-hemolysin-like protein
MEDHSRTKELNISRPKNKTKSNQTIFNKFAKIGNSVGTIFQNNKKPYLLKSLNKTINGCQKSGLLSFETKKMIKNILNIEDIRVENVMTPRTDVIAIQHNSSLGDIKKLIIENEHTRIPVFKRNLDSIIGFIHSKDLAKFIGCEDVAQTENFSINDVIRKILYVPHSMRIIDLLLKMRSSRVHIAIVLDEYGGTDGLVSIEDIVEEIVGEIEDEHDMPDDNIYLRIQNINENTIHVGGRVEIDKISEFITSNLVIEDIDSDFDTVGGLMFAIFKKVPEVGEIHDTSGLSFKILAADARSVKLIEISKIENEQN